MSLKRDNSDFARDLAKGKIAETIFWMMFRDDERYFIFPYGYEHLIPDLTRFKKELIEGKQSFKHISENPDYILMTTDRTKLQLIDVKFRWDYLSNLSSIKSKAEKTLLRWEECYYFIATPKGFYFDTCESIVKNHGRAKELSTDFVGKDTQEKYLKLLQEFLQFKIVKNAGHPSILCKCSMCNETIEFPIRNMCPRCKGDIIT